MTLRRHPLLDHRPATPEAFAAVEVAAAMILRTDEDVVIVQAEAALALEAVLLGVVRPGIARSASAPVPTASGSPTICGSSAPRSPWSQSTPARPSTRPTWGRRSRRIRRSSSWRSCTPSR